LVPSPFGHPWWFGAFSLLGPPLVTYIFLFPRALRKASVGLVLVSALLALVNGPLEEVLWRGAYLTLFAGQFWLALLYPSLDFAL
jgi:CAAX prenyl protease-like protein